MVLEHVVLATQRICQTSIDRYHLYPNGLFRNMILCAE